MTTATATATTVDRDAYRHARQQGFPAHHAFRLARAERTEHRYPLDDGNLEFHDDETGFTVRFTVEPDIVDSPEEWLGEWTDDRWADGAVENPAAHFYMDENGMRRNASQYYGYFIPAYTYEMRYADAQRRGYSKNDADIIARQQVRDDALLASEYESVILACKVSLGGIILGRSALCGITTARQSYSEVWDMLSDLAGDVAADAIAEAVTEAEKIADHICDSVHGGYGDEWQRYNPPVEWMIGKDALGTPYGPRCPNGCLRDAVVTASRPAAIRCYCERCDAEWTENIVTID